MYFCKILSRRYYYFCFGFCYQLSKNEKRGKYEPDLNPRIKKNVVFYKRERISSGFFGFVVILVVGVVDVFLYHVIASISFSLSMFHDPLM